MYALASQDPWIGDQCGYFWTWYLFFSLMYALLAAQDPEENTWEPLENLGEAEKAIKLFEKEQVTLLREGNMTIVQILQELKGHAAAKAQGQNNKRTYAKVLLLLMLNWSQLIPFTRRLRGDRLKSLPTKPPEWR